jgi:hypothetical protein
VLLAGAVAILFPATLNATPQIGERHNGFSKTDERYLAVYERCFDAFGADCGRNRVDDGNEDGTQPTDAQVVASTERMRSWLNPPEPVAPVVSESVAPAPASVSEAPAPVSTGSSNAYVDPSCESGGDPTVYDPSGTYWGKYQFDQQTWSAYAESGSWGSASEAEQDAAAANVPYDAWPNC